MNTDDEFIKTILEGIMESQMFQIEHEKFAMGARDLTLRKPRTISLKHLRYSWDVWYAN